MPKKELKNRVNVKKKFTKNCASEQLFLNSKTEKVFNKWRNSVVPKLKKINKGKN